MTQHTTFVTPSGSVRENIASFSNKPDEELVVASAKRARVHQAILRSPMGYNSQIGDLGDGFSSGERQRILIARAFYRRPKVLFFDEATSHMDEATEQEILRDAVDAHDIVFLVSHKKSIRDRFANVVGEIDSKGKVVWSDNRLESHEEVSASD